MTSSEAGDRHQVELPGELVAILDQFSSLSGRSISDLVSESVRVYLKLMSDESSQGAPIPSHTSHSLTRLHIELGWSLEDLVRVAAALGCRIMEEPSIQGNEATLFDDLFDEAESAQRYVADVLVEHLRRAMAHPTEPESNRGESGENR